MDMIVNFLTIVNRDFRQRKKFVRPHILRPRILAILTNIAYAASSLLPDIISARSWVSLSAKSPTLML